MRNVAYVPLLANEGFTTVVSSTFCSKVDEYGQHAMSTTTNFMEVFELAWQDEHSRSRRFGRWVKGYSQT